MLLGVGPSEVGGALPSLSVSCFPLARVKTYVLLPTHFARNLETASLRSAANSSVSNRNIRHHLRSEAVPNRKQKTKQKNYNGNRFAKRFSDSFLFFKIND